MSNNKDKDKGKGNRSINNPYLTAPARPEAARLTLGSELKRLAGLPFRLPTTLGLVVLPLVLALAGALDLATGWLYTLAHHTRVDPRPTASLLDCLADQSKKLCNGLVWASPASPKRIVLYPWHGSDFLHQYEPGLFLALFALAVLAFAAIGSPNAIRVGKAVISVIGVKRWAKQAATNQELGLGTKNPKEKAKKQKGKEGNEETQVEEVGIIPALQIDNEPDGPVKAWQSSLVLGGHLPRMWESDPGYFYLDREVQPVPYWLTLDMLRTNLVIVAPQGSGKTYSVYRPMLTFMRRSHSVAIFWDSKGDDFDSTYFDYNFDPEHPDVSIKLNIFAGENPTQAGERLAEALIPDLGGDKQYFSNNAKDAMAALTAAHNIVYERNPKLTDLLNYLTSPTKVQSLSDMVLEAQRGPQQYEEALRTAAQLRRVLQLAENKNTDVLGSLATALNPLVTGSAAKVLVTNSDEAGAEEVYTIEKLLQKPGLIRLSLPVAKSPRLAPILGRLILSQFTYAVLSPDCNRKLFKMAAVDEARHFITDNVANGMAQARSNNAGYVLALQTLTQIKDESLLDTIFAVSGTKIVMAGVGEKDARRFSDTFGQLELPYVTHSQGQSRGTTQNNSSGYSRGQEYEFFGRQSGHEARSSRNTSHGRGQTNSQNTNSLTSTRVRPRFFPAEIRELNQFTAVVESSDAQGRRWFAQVIDMRSSTVHRLENRVLEQLRHLRDLQKQKHTSRSGPGSKGQHYKQPTQTSEPAPDQKVIAKPGAEPDQSEGKEGTENAGASAKHPVEGHLNTAAPVRKRLLTTVRFLPVETNVVTTRPESAAEKGVKGKVTENSEQSLTSRAAASLEKNSEPETDADDDKKEGVREGNEATGFPLVSPSTGAVGEEPEQPSATAAPKPQPSSKEEMQIHEPQIKQLRSPLPPVDQEKEEQFGPGSFLNNPEAIPGVEKEAVTPVAVREITSPELEPGSLPEIAPKKPRKRKITRVVGEIIPAPVDTPTPFKETGFTAEPGAEAGKGAVGKEKPKDPAGLL